MHRAFRGYQLVTRLVRNTSNSFYLAHSTTLATEKVVVKLFDPISLDREQEQVHFLQEVHALKQLHHPYVLPLLDGGIEQGHPFLVSRYAPHGSLRGLLTQASSAPISLGEALQIIVRVGQALSYAHSWNILHANIKPENVLFGDDGKALLADFTPCSVLTNTVSNQLLDSRVARYMAPEQQVGILSKESDQYAFGCLAYEILTGHPPFPSGTFEPPLPLTQFVPDLPEQSEVAVFKALATDPSERHASVAAFIEALTARSLKVIPSPSVEAIAEPLQRTPNALVLETPSVTNTHQPDGVSVPLSPLLSAATAMLSPERSPATYMVPAQSDATEPVPASYHEETTAIVPVVMVNGLDNSQLDSLDKANTLPLRHGEINQKTPSHHKRKAMKGNWIVLSLACLFVLVVGLVSLHLLSSEPSTPTDKPEITTPMEQGGTATVTIVQATPTMAPTLQPDGLIPPVSATQGAITTPASTPGLTPTPQPTSTPQPTPTPTSAPAPSCKHAGVHC